MVLAIVHGRQLVDDGCAQRVDVRVVLDGAREEAQEEQVVHAAVGCDFLERDGGVELAGVFAAERAVELLECEIGAGLGTVGLAAAGELADQGLSWEGGVACVAAAVLVLRGTDAGVVHEECLALFDVLLGFDAEDVLEILRAVVECHVVAD